MLHIPVAIINTLPPEVLCAIYLLVYNDYPPETRVQDVLRLSWVCHLWRNLVHAHVLLWTHVHLNRTHPELMQLCLTKSRGAPISVSLELDITRRSLLEYSPIENSKQLMANIDLMQMLRLLISCDVDISSALNALERFEQTSNLRELVIIIEGYTYLHYPPPPRPFQARCPMLRKLDLKNYLPHCTSLFWDSVRETLKELVVRSPCPMPPVGELLTILEKTRRLTVLHIWDDLFPPPPEENLVRSYPTVVLPEITRCELSMEFHDLFCLLSSLSMLNLSRLHIGTSRVRNSRRDQFNGCLRAFPFLGTLRSLIISMSSMHCRLEGWFSGPPKLSIMKPSSEIEPNFTLSSGPLPSLINVISPFGTKLERLSIVGGSYPSGDMGRLPHVSTVHLRQTDIRILLELYLYGVFDQEVLQEVELEEVNVCGRWDLICNFKGVKTVRLKGRVSMSLGVWERLRSKGLVLERVE